MESPSKVTMKGNLPQHMKSIHVEVKYSCEYCDYKATQKGNLQQHVKSIHDGVKHFKDIVTTKQPRKIKFRNTNSLSIVCIHKKCNLFFIVSFVL